MKTWHIGLFLLLSIIIFGQYIFNFSFAGADSWFYINQICGQTQFSSTDVLFDIIMPFFPCDFVVLKIYLAVLFFVMLVISAKIGELYNKDHGWLLALIIGAFTMFPIDFIMFENDSLGFVLIFASLYFVLDVYKNNKNLISIESFFGLCLICAAGLVWKGAAYFLIVFVILNPVIFFIPAVIVSFLYFDTLFWFVTASRLVAEQTMFIGIIYYGVTTLFLFGLAKMTKKEALICIIMIIPALFVQKLYVLAIPFMGIMTLTAILSLKKHQPLIIQTIIIFSVFMAAFWGMHTYNQFPTPEDFVIVQQAAQITNNVENSFGIGYVAIFNDLNVSSYGSTDGNDYRCAGYVLEHPWNGDCNYCATINESDNIALRKC